MRQLRNSSPRGADGHCRQGILPALLAASLENIDTFTGLARRLEFDLRFRYQCGLRLDIPAPSISALSRVFAELTRKSLAPRLLEDLVAQCQEAGIIDGTHVAIGSAAIQAYEKKEPKRKSELTGNAKGELNSIRLVIKSSGLAISYIWPSTRRVNFQLPKTLHLLM